MNFFPFNLPGPQFLAFYVALMAVVFLGVWWRLRGMESDQSEFGSTALNTVAQDPLLLACLRGGRNDVLRVAVVSLLDRGLLTASGRDLKTASLEVVDKVRRPLERAILTRFTRQRPAQDLFTDGVILAEAGSIGEPLRLNRLLPDDGIRAARRGLLLCGLCILWGVAGVKTAVAISKGHHNLGFLFGLAILSTIVLAVTTRRFRTAGGDRVLARIQDMLAGLKTRRSNRADHTGEVAFLAAAFGLSALPAEMAAAVNPLQLKPRPQNGGSGDYGSSCSSGSSCSGGSSCGGGGGGGSGCGGGCGGCG